MPFYGQSSANSNVKLLQCYDIFLTSRNLTCTRVKNTLQSRNDSVHQRTLRKSSTPQVWNGTGTVASPPPMPKHKTVVHFPLPHQWCGKWWTSISTPDKLSTIILIYKWRKSTSVTLLKTYRYQREKVICYSSWKK